MMDDFRAQLPAVTLLNGRTAEDVESEMVAEYQAQYTALTGKYLTWMPGTSEALKIAAVAQQIHHVEQYVEAMYHRQFLKYATGDDLDNLGALFGLTRRQATRAETTLQFSMTEPRQDATAIPAGTRAATQNGVYFVTDTYAEIPAGEKDITVRASCVLLGSLGNGYQPGTIMLIVDPLPYIAAVQNTGVSIGGAEIESDLDFAYRIYLAPPAYSTAGPQDAYRYLARTARPDIVDANATSPEPGVALISILMKDGLELTSEVKSDIADYISGSTRRPMTDAVRIESAATVPYTINVTYYIAQSSAGQAATIQAAVNTAVTEYIQWQRVIGRDINPSELIRRIMQAGAKRCELLEPQFVKVNDVSVPNMTSQVVTYGGLEHD